MLAADREKPGRSPAERGCRRVSHTRGTAPGGGRGDCAAVSSHARITSRGTMSHQRFPRENARTRAVGGSRRARRPAAFPFSPGEAGRAGGRREGAEGVVAFKNEAPGAESREGETVAVSRSVWDTRWKRGGQPGGPRQPRSASVTRGHVSPTARPRMRLPLARPQAHPAALPPRPLLSVRKGAFLSPQKFPHLCLQISYTRCPKAARAKGGAGGGPWGSGPRMPGGWGHARNTRVPCPPVPIPPPAAGAVSLHRRPPRWPVPALQQGSYPRRPEEAT